ncbi:uncharacterized protein A4U43_UnF8280 [Asparagus officinalis]|uniref:Uncharacterized protein n=1 Tax=Asparagus officinalis TaxID=4686 RepID=A0A1R3L5Z6_ASPOF|nr:uncharacterized protein A4U43_UnF8280 [Asparagus officinalis]
MRPATGGPSAQAELAGWRNWSRAGAGAARRLRRRVRDAGERACRGEATGAVGGRWVGTATKPRLRRVGSRSGRGSAAGVRREVGRGGCLVGEGSGEEKEGAWLLGFFRRERERMSGERERKRYV